MFLLDFDVPEVFLEVEEVLFGGGCGSEGKSCRIWNELWVLRFLNSGREVLRRKSSLVSWYSFCAFFMAALERASKDLIVLRNCSGSMVCLLGGSLSLRNFGIS